MVSAATKFKKRLLLGRTAKTNNNVLKSRDIILPTKFCLVKTMVSAVVMYGCEIWTIKKGWALSTDAFELWFWRRLLKVPWTARRSNQSILKEISPGCSLEGLMLKLKLQYFGHLMWRVDSLEKALMLGEIEGRRRGQHDEMAGWHHWHDGHEFEQASGKWWRTGKAGVLQSMGSQRVRHDLATEWQKSDISEYVNCHLFMTSSLLSFLIKDADSVSNYSPTICPHF